MTVRSAHRGAASYFLLLFVGIVLCCASLSVFVTTTAHALSASQTSAVELCRKPFFGLAPWYQYLGDKLDPSDCSIKCFNFIEQQNPTPAEKCGNGKSDIPLVLLAVIDDLLRIAGIAAIGFIMYGAFQYVTSQGDPDGTAKAQKTIINSLVGLALALTAVAIISFLGKSLGGP